RAPRGEHHPLSEQPTLRRGGVQRLALAHGADHAWRGVRILLPEERRRAHHHRGVGGTDRDPRERVPRNTNRRAHPLLRREGGGRMDPRDPGSFHLLHRVRPATRGGAPPAVGVPRVLAGWKRRRGGGMTKVIAAALFLALQYYVYNHFASVEVHPPRASFAGFPLELGGWHCDQRQPMEARVIANLGVTDYLMCSYHNALAPAAPVGVYVGYHASQVNTAGGKENRFHPPAHCLPGSGWDILASEDRVVDLPGLPG